MKPFFLAVLLLLSISGWAAMKRLPHFRAQAPATTIGSYNARTDFAVVPVPNPVPNMGGATGVGNGIVDPDFNTHIYRLTDINTVPHARYAPQQNWQMSCGGWGASRVSNVDSTKIFICHDGGRAFLLPFDPSTGKAGPVHDLPPGVASFPEWSKTEKDVAFGLAPSKDPIIVRLDFSASSPKVTSVVNLAKVPSCAQQFSGKAAWMELSFAWDDATFAVAVGKGIQGSADLVYVWNAKTGCHAYDTESGTIDGSPVTGTTDRYPIHAIQISGNGKVVAVVPSGGDNLRHFWHVGTTEVDAAQSDVDYGHYALGYDSFLNAGGRTADGKWCKLGMAIRSLSVAEPANYVLTSKQCADTLARGDDHLSWNNDDKTDKQPFATSTVTVPLGSPITAPWQDEVLVFMQNGIVHREAHTFNSGSSKFFTCQNAIGSISQDGKWFFFSSDWEGTLGTDINRNQRCDDFAVELH
jgi:hypothetical protein